jgi:hypothetical protein
MICMNNPKKTLKGKNGTSEVPTAWIEFTQIRWSSAPQGWGPPRKGQNPSTVSDIKSET